MVRWCSMLELYYPPCRRSYWRRCIQNYGTLLSERSIWCDPGIWKGIPDHPAAVYFQHHGNLFMKKTPEQGGIFQQKKSRWDRRCKVKVKVNIKQGNCPKYQKRQYNNNSGQKVLSREKITGPTLTKATNHSIIRDQKQNQNYCPQNTKGFQGQGQGQVMQQPWIDCGIVLPSKLCTGNSLWEISKTLNTHPHPQRQASALPQPLSPVKIKKTQVPTMVTELTSWP